MDMPMVEVELLEKIQHQYKIIESLKGEKHFHNVVMELENVRLRRVVDLVKVLLFEKMISALTAQGLTGSATRLKDVRKAMNDLHVEEGSDDVCRTCAPPLSERNKKIFNGIKYAGGNDEQEQ